MADRTRDIVRLREAARLCRVKAEIPCVGAGDFGRLALEIDSLIRALSAETSMKKAPLTDRFTHRSA